MILDVSKVQGIYLAIEPVDMRKSINGLSLLVQAQFDLDATSRSLFIFTNKPKNKLKMIYYDQGGFWLLMKRLDKGTFQWVVDKDNHTRVIDNRQLSWLLDGLNIDQKRKIESVQKSLIY
jgi:transposase